MAWRDPMAPPSTVELRHADDFAHVKLMGAELVGLVMGGRELLWAGDARFWAQSSPLLFPVVGRLREGVARFGAVATSMPLHGFASSCRFEAVDRSPESVTLLLQSDDFTRALYPFDFELVVEYLIGPGGLAVELWLRNTAAQPMPWSMGLHPGFRWPWAGEGPLGHSVIFANDESPLVPVITRQGLFTRQQRQVPLVGRQLRLDPGLFDQEALCFLNARSRTLGLQAPDGSCIEIESQGFSHWALWSRPGAPFLCIESWTGHGDMQDWTGEFADRPFTRILAPGASTRLSQRIRYRAAPAGP